MAGRGWLQAVAVLTLLLTTPGPRPPLAVPSLSGPSPRNVIRGVAARCRGLRGCQRQAVGLGGVDEARKGMC